MKILLKWMISALSLLLTAYLLPKLGIPGIVVDSFYTALIVALVLGILHFTVRPILLILTLPINLITFGLFTFIINGLLFWFTASFIAGFHTVGFLGAVFGALCVSLLTSIGYRLIDWEV
ncbi:MAG: phage holin family protein [Minisyncoccota bacterium]